MTQDTDKSIQALLDDPQLSKELRDSFRVLEIIRTLTSSKPDVRPFEIIEEFYRDKLENVQPPEKRKEFLETKKSRISRMISSLVAMELVEECDPHNKLDKRNKHYRLTKKGLTLLDTEEFRLRLETEVIVKQDQTRVDPKEYMEQFKRKYHSDSIRTLLKRMRNEIDQAFIKDYTPDEINFPLILYKLDRFPFESDALYDDLPHHMVTFLRFDRFKELLERFRETAKEFVKMESTIETLVRLELERALGLPPYINDTAMNGYTLDLVQWIVNGLDLLDQQRIESFNRYYRDFTSEVRTVHIGNRRLKLVVVNGTNALILFHTEGQAKYLDRLKGLIDQINGTPLMKDHSTYKSLEEQIGKTQAELVLGLSKEIEIPVYPGKCPYLVPDNDSSGQDK